MPLRGMPYGRMVVIASDVGAESPTKVAGYRTTTTWKIDMPTPQERRKSARVPSMRACPYELTEPVGPITGMWSAGHAYSINRSVGGMLLLLPGTVVTRHVFEVQVPSQARETQITKLGEVRWTRPIPVSARANMYLVGIRFLFELPVFG